MLSAGVKSAKKFRGEEVLLSKTRYGGRERENIKKAGGYRADFIIKLEGEWDGYMWTVLTDGALIL